MMKYWETKRLALRVGPQISFKSKRVDSRNKSFHCVQRRAGNRCILGNMASAQERKQIMINSTKRRSFLCNERIVTKRDELSTAHNRIFLVAKKQKQTKKSGIWRKNTEKLTNKTETAYSSILFRLKGQIGEL